MNFEVCVIFDTKAKVYSRPLFFPTLAIIDRYAQDVLKSDNDISRHPSDFSLFHIGSYNDKTATFDLLTTPTCLIRFHEVPVVTIPDNIVDATPGDTYSSAAYSSLRRVSPLNPSPDA